MMISSSDSNDNDNLNDFDPHEDSYFGLNHLVFNQINRDNQHININNISNSIHSLPSVPLQTLQHNHNQNALDSEDNLSISPSLSLSLTSSSVPSSPSPSISSSLSSSLPPSPSLSSSPPTHSLSLFDRRHKMSLSSSPSPSSYSPSSSPKLSSSNFPSMVTASSHSSASTSSSPIPITNPIPSPTPSPSPSVVASLAISSPSLADGFQLLLSWRSGWMLSMFPTLSSPLQSSLTTSLRQWARERALDKNFNEFSPKELEDLNLPNEDSLIKLSEWSSSPLLSLDVSSFRSSLLIAINDWKNERIMRNHRKEYQFQLKLMEIEKIKLSDLASEEKSERIKVEKDRMEKEEKMSNIINHFKQNEEHSSPSCVVCFSETRTILYDKCKHIAVCSSCDASINNCPLCGAKVEGKTKVFF